MRGHRKSTGAGNTETDEHGCASGFCLFALINSFSLLHFESSPEPSVQFLCTSVSILTFIAQRGENEILHRQAPKTNSTPSQLPHLSPCALSFANENNRNQMPVVL